MPEALDDSEYRRLLQFRTALRRFLHWSGQQAEAVGLTPSQHQLLLDIRGHDDARGPTIGEVAGYLLLRHHSAVGLVDRAEEAGLVERLEDGKDRRVVRLRLTSRGEETLRSLSAAHLEELERLAPQIWQPILALSWPSNGWHLSSVEPQGQQGSTGTGCDGERVLVLGDAAWP